MSKNKLPDFAARAILPIIFISGCCALTYQVCWFREFRLVFGTSTASNSAVVAIFMGGLGLGGFFFGRVVDRSRRPFFIYALLEIIIALSALLSPFGVAWTKKFYIFTGGIAANGPIVSTLTLLFLSVLVMGLPTFLMGGTLPALAATVENRFDRGRRNVGLIYGVNTLGGVLGVLIATFYLLEAIGNRQTIWLASSANLIVGLAALFIFYILKKQPQESMNLAAAHGITSDIVIKNRDESSRPYFVYVASLIVGFSFFLMELVWYRMLAPILGGTTYTFGLVLATALSGIGVGAWLYRLGSLDRRVTIWAFVYTCVLEAFFIGLPYALGDRLAILTAVLRSLSVFGFSGHIIGWSFICTIVVFPAAVAAGFQFPVLISLLGQGREGVGKHTGFVYLWNTIGAILGALAGGFGFIPLFSATGCWRGVVVILLTLGFAALALHWRQSRNYVFGLVVILVLFSSSLVFLNARGPTAAWRHSSIGVGLAPQLGQMNRNELQSWLNDYRRQIIWEKDGIESGLGILANDSISLIINGKSDGNAREDAGTQVMAPMIGAILHPGPKKAMVLGLGTGSSAGWLGQIGSIDKVDVVELEPGVLEMVRRSSPVNHNVLGNRKVNVIIGDGREFLLTTKDKYDLIVSEPSNPYRAGISSLYTQDFYRAVSNRLDEDGVFTQWVQAYHVDSDTIRTLYATLTSVFPHVETWATDISDMQFVCSLKKQTYDVPVLTSRVKSEPFHDALKSAWGVTDLEGFLAGFIANNETAQTLGREGRQHGPINTDDRMVTEFGFARTLGETGLFSINAFRNEVRERGQHRPELFGGDVDWSHVDSNYLAINFGWIANRIPEIPGLSNEDRMRHQVYNVFREGNFPAISSSFRNGLWEALVPFDLAVLGEALADDGDHGAVARSVIVGEYWPGMADAILSRYYWRINDKDQAMAEIEKAFKSFRSDPWQNKTIMTHTLSLAVEMASADKDLALQLEKLLSEPFSVLILDDYRKFSLMQVAAVIDSQHGAKAMALWEPYVPWRENILRYRQKVYEETGHPLAEKATYDLQIFLENMKKKPVFISNES